MSWALAVPMPLSSRTLNWSGHTWEVHVSDHPVGAGPNRWSNTEAAVCVEGSALVLTLQQDGEGWQSVELSTPMLQRPRGLRVELDVGTLDSRVVAGVFFYKDDSSELDLEVARWGDPHALPFQFAVAPADSPELVHRFPVSRGRSSHQLRWRRRAVLWTSTSAAGATAWQLHGPDVPRFDGHRLHVNLWVMNGGAPAGDGEISIRVDELRVFTKPRGCTWSECAE